MEVAGAAVVGGGHGGHSGQPVSAGGVVPVGVGVVDAGVGFVVESGAVVAAVGWLRAVVAPRVLRGRKPEGQSRGAGGVGFVVPLHLRHQPLALRRQRRRLSRHGPLRPAQ